MIERERDTRPAAERAWSGGRPWTAPRVPAADQVEPRAELSGTGADLAVALAAVAAELDSPELTGVGVHARAQLVDLTVAAERVIAWATGVQARAVAALHRQFMAEHDLDDQELDESDAVPAEGRTRRSRHLSEELGAFHDAGQATAACLSLALGVSTRSADRILALALGLSEATDLADALGQGRVDAAQARVIQEATTALPPTQRAEVIARIVTDPETVAGDPSALVPELRDGATPVWAVPAHQLRPIIAREIAALAPESVEAVEQVVDRGRRVAYYPASLERSGALVLHGPEPQLAAVYDRLDAGARAARQAGAPETLDQLRYDVAVGALTDGTFGLTIGTAEARPGVAVGQPRETSRPRIGIDVVVAADTLLGLDERPATLRTAAGDVPISAAEVRRLAHDRDATWRRILTDPATGVAVDVSQRYRPARRVADYVTVRDGHTSRFPTSAARHLELDHVVEFDHSNPARGGPTSAANLASTGKRDHQAKTDRLVTVTGDANELLTYRTGSGHAYPSRPHRYSDPYADPTGDPPF